MVIPAVKSLPLEKRILAVNLFILALVAIGSVAKPVTAAGAGILLLYLILQAVRRPGETLFLAFGIKLTYDALWDVDFFTAPGVGTVGPLDLFLAVILVLAFKGPRIEGPRAARLYALPAAYVLWTAAAAAGNGILPGLEVILRQAGIFFGVVIGVKYIRSRADLDRMILAVFLSTIVPVLASTLDAVLGPVGISIFHYKTSTIRGLRLSGLYYDSATTGMMAILACFTGLYLFGQRLLPARARVFQVAFVLLAFAVIVTGGTRSVTLVAIVGMALLMVRNRRTAFTVIPLLLVLGYFAQPFVNKMMARTEFEVKEPIRVERFLADTSYRRLFTGRVAIWQDIWAEFNEGSTLQVLFGHGRTSNAHSAYFFLLLQVGWLGLGLYLWMHGSFLKGIWQSGADPPVRNFALVCHLGFLMVGFTMATVMYTSFQWITFLFVAAVTTGLAPLKAEAAIARRSVPAGAGDERAAVPVAVEPSPGHAAAAGGSGTGAPPINYRPSGFDRIAASYRWLFLAAVPALCIGGLLVYWQKNAVRPAGDRSGSVEGLPSPAAAPPLSLPAAPSQPVVETGGMVPEEMPTPLPVDTGPPRKARPPSEPVAEEAPTVREPSPQQGREETPDQVLEPVPMSPSGADAEPRREPPLFDTAAALAAAAALMEQGSVAEAEESYRAIVARDPGVSEAYMALGEIALERGDFQAATKYFRLAEAIVRSGE